MSYTDNVNEAVKQDEVPGNGLSTSGFRFYSIGVVAANKKLSSISIEAVPIEHFSFVDGELTDHKEELDTKTENYNEEKSDVKVDTTPSIMARWLPMGQTSRKTAPDVRRGEVVMLYQFGDTDEFWWMDMMQYKKIRRLETQSWAISNNAKENAEDTPDSTYWFEWSTHRQVLHLHTSKSNEEPFEYDIQIDTKNGKIVIKDDDENYIFMDSANRRIKAHNKDTSYVDIDKKIITLHSLDKVHVKTKHFIVDAQETIKMTTKDYSIKTNSYKVTASSWLTKVPTAQFSNNTVINGNNSVGGFCTDSRGSHG